MALCLAKKECFIQAADWAKVTSDCFQVALYYIGW